jgi:hypothetical protein
MRRFTQPDSEIISRHRFTRPHIRLWLPVIMFGLLAFCGWVLGPRFGVLELLALVFVAYVATSALVTVVEISVIEEGLIIHRLILPKRFVPWDAIDRMVVHSYQNGETGVYLEVASIGLYEGLSPLNRLPGPVYGQGLRQTFIITPDTLEDYDSLLEVLEERVVVVRHDADH